MSTRETSLARSPPTSSWICLLSDFNAHNSLWGSSQTFQRGALLEQLLLGNNLVLLNTGEPTHICIAIGSTSSIDLALCSWSVALHLDWTVLSDLHGSDHFPVIIHISMPSPALEHTPHRIFGRADWIKFRASIHLSYASFEDVSAMAQHFTNAILTAAKASIPQSSGMAPHPPVPWWIQTAQLPSRLHSYHPGPETSNDSAPTPTYHGQSHKL